MQNPSIISTETSQRVINFLNKFADDDAQLDKDDAKSVVQLAIKSHEVMKKGIGYDYVTTKQKNDVENKVVEVAGKTVANGMLDGTGKPM